METARRKAYAVLMASSSERDPEFGIFCERIWLSVADGRSCALSLTINAQMNVNAFSS